MNARKELIETYKAAVIAIAKRGTLSNGRHTVSAAEQAAGIEPRNGVYAHATNTKADFVAYCEARAAELQIEADRAAGRPVDEEGNDTREWCGNDIKAAHAEALEIEARRRIAAFFGGLDYAGRRAAVDAAHEEALAIDAAYNLQIAFACKTPAYQQKLIEWAHTDALDIAARTSPTFEKDHSMNRLAKPQLIDIIRGHARRAGASLDQQEAIGELRETELRKLVATMLRNGHRITAHLYKTRTGYGHIIFGSEGVYPASYHKVNVGSMKEARKLCKDAGAWAWNF